MNMISEELADSKNGDEAKKVTVRLSNELVHLLSDQLYQSPLKAIEELVVNSYDAEAEVCKLFVPASSEIAQSGGRHFMAVFDDGTGLSAAGMTDLWHVGQSNKRTEEITKRAKRTQIGKFGIGKLATYTVCSRLTYISKTVDGVLSASLDFNRFTHNAEGAGAPVEIPVIKLKDWSSFAKAPLLEKVLQSTGVTEADLSKPSWTIAVLEALKPKASQIKLGMLNWVLATAMPLKSGFRVFLNGAEIHSSKESADKAAEFDITELPKSRLDELNKATGDAWKIERGKLVSKTFPKGVSGTVIVTIKTLAGKSDDLLRSYGFFVRVLGRLINQDQPFFGMTPLRHGTLNRFRADIDADDLDSIITAPREGVENSPARDNFEHLLVEIFQEARQRYEKYLSDLDDKEARKKEHSREFVSNQLIELPIAGALLQTDQSEGAEPDNSWFYLTIDKARNPIDIASILYTQKRTKFSFQYSAGGKQSRMVKFDPANSAFVVNSDHEFVVAHSDERRAQIVLEDMLIAEALLEVHLRINKVAPQLIGEILQERDRLLRGLAMDHPYSSIVIAKSLRDSADNEHDLELALVAATRALGFVAKHISGEGEPDGIARFVDYPKSLQSITLEAKSSASVPQLSQLDFGGLKQHVTQHGAQGCLLVAPSYPGLSRADSSAASQRAREQKISCWTIEQLARVVESAEVRHITAKDILKIVLGSFDPQQVSAEIDKLFASPNWDRPTLNFAIIGALKSLENRLADSPRTLDMISSEVSRDTHFLGISREDVRKAVSDMAAQSQGGMYFNGDEITLFVSIEELKRRLGNGLTQSPLPYRASTLIDGKGKAGEPLGEY
jgi:hypothetical protein